MGKIKSFIEKYANATIQDVCFKEVIKDIHEVVIGVPFPIVSLWNGETIERIRNNYNEEIFYRAEDIYLRKDIENITEYGRVNSPYTSRFYGTLGDNNPDKARITTLLETNKILRSEDLNSDVQQIFTTGLWEVKCDLRILVLPFHPLAYKNSRLKYASENFSKTIKEEFPEIATEVFGLVHFFSDHFGRKVLNHFDYKLTAAFGEVFLTDYGLDGIIYPSIRAEYETQNIVLTPQAAKNLNLYKVGMFEVFIHKNQVFYEPIAYCDKMDSNSPVFEWKYLERLPIDEINKKIKK